MENPYLEYVYNYRDGRNINKIASDHDSKLSGGHGGYRAWSLYLAENGPVGFMSVTMLCMHRHICICCGLRE